jgi:hypothetical protein
MIRFCDPQLTGALPRLSQVDYEAVGTVKGSLQHFYRQWLMSFLSSATERG